MKYLGLLGLFINLVFSQKNKNDKDYQPKYDASNKDICKHFPDFTYYEFDSDHLHGLTTRSCLHHGAQLLAAGMPVMNQADDGTFALATTLAETVQVTEMTQVYSALECLDKVTNYVGASYMFYSFDGTVTSHCFAISSTADLIIEGSQNAFPSTTAPANGRYTKVANILCIAGYYEKRLVPRYASGKMACYTPYYEPHHKPKRDLLTCHLYLKWDSYNYGYGHGGYGQDDKYDHGGGYGHYDNYDSSYDHDSKYGHGYGYNREVGYGGYGHGSGAHDFNSHGGHGRKLTQQSFGFSFFGAGVHDRTYYELGCIWKKPDSHYGHYSLHCIDSYGKLTTKFTITKLEKPEKEGKYCTVKAFESHMTFEGKGNGHSIGRVGAYSPVIYDTTGKMTGSFHRTHKHYFPYYYGHPPHGYHSNSYRSYSPHTTTTHDSNSAVSGSPDQTD